MTPKDTRHLHERRGITFAELGALLGTRELLARKLMPHMPLHGYGPGRQQLVERIKSAHAFDMRTPFQANAYCGSVQCIGGTMAILLQVGSPSDYVWRQRGIDPLYNLFFPHIMSNWDRITPKVAVKAIDNWLATGDPKWRSLLPIRASKPTKKARRK